MSLGQLAGVEHVAAGVDDGVERRPLAGQRGGHRLVDATRSRRRRRPGRPGSGRAGTAPTSSRSTSPAACATLERPRGQRLGGVAGRPSGRPGRPTASRAAGPARAGREQPLRPADPSVGGGEVGEVRLVGDRQPHRAARRPGDVVVLAEQRVRPRAALHARHGSHPATTGRPPARSTLRPSRVRERPPRTPPGHLPTGPHPGRRTPRRPGRRSSRHHCGAPGPSRGWARGADGSVMRRADPDPTVGDRREDPPRGSGMEQGLPRYHRIDHGPTVAAVRMVAEPAYSPPSATGSPSTSGGSR